MSGGACEYMASYMETGDMTNSEMAPIIAEDKYSKYLDKYSSESTLTSYKKRILGDATGEMGPFLNIRYYESTWYDDQSDFFSSTGYWFSRGGYFDSTTRSGQFFYSKGSGLSSSDSFRLILTPTN